MVTLLLQAIYMKNERWVNKSRKDIKGMLSLYNALNTNGMFDKDIIEAEAVLNFIESLLED